MTQNETEQGWNLLTVRSQPGMGPNYYIDEHNGGLFTADTLMIGGVRVGFVEEAQIECEGYRIEDGILIIDPVEEHT